MGYAKGSKSVAISDISVVKIPYKSLKRTWDGYYVEPEEYDPKHPQLSPAKNITDATALSDPRPGNHRQENVDIFIGYNYDPFVDALQRPPVGVPSRGAVGFLDHIRADCTLTASGTRGIGAVGTTSVVINVDISATGAAGTGATGAETLESEIIETGVAGTGALGSISVEVNRGWGEDAWGTGAWGE